MSYLNTKPLVYGLERGMMKDQLDIVYDYPSAIAKMLLEDQIDVGLVPVAIIPKLKEAHLISDYCIGAEKEVASVCLFSEVELQQVEKIMLDYQSRTSVALTKLLVRDHWRLRSEFLATGTDYRDHIHGTTAGLVIGDRALSQRKISPYIFDLASAWKDFTGLPFVFATWVSNKKLDDDFTKQFNDVNRYGLEHIEAVIASHPFDDYDLYTYYTRNISYQLTDDKMKGLQTFLSMID